jgi:hypothetical protein
MQKARILTRFRLPAALALALLWVGNVANAAPANRPSHPLLDRLIILRQTEAELGVSTLNALQAACPDLTVSCGLTDAQAKGIRREAKRVASSAKDLAILLDLRELRERRPDFDVALAEKAAALQLAIEHPARNVTPSIPSDSVAAARSNEELRFLIAVGLPKWLAAGSVFKQIRELSQAKRVVDRIQDKATVRPLWSEEVDAIRALKALPAPTAVSAPLLSSRPLLLQYHSYLTWLASGAKGQWKRP